MLPRWVLKQKFLPKGNHLEKFPKYVAPVAAFSSPYGQAQPPPRDMWRGHRMGSGFDDKNFDVQGNLSNDEYRFFGGMAGEASQTSQCRGCGQSFFSIESRRQHRVMGCMRILTDAYAMLKGDHLCLICGHYTTNLIWGVPLCQVKQPAGLRRYCIHSFKFVTTRPMRLIEAIDAVKKRNRQGDLRA